MNIERMQEKWGRCSERKFRKIAGEMKGAYLAWADRSNSVAIETIDWFVGEDEGRDPQVTCQDYAKLRDQVLADLWAKSTKIPWEKIPEEVRAFLCEDLDQIDLLVSCCAGLLHSADLVELGAWYPDPDDPDVPNDPPDPWQVRLEALETFGELKVAVARVPRNMISLYVRSYITWFETRVLNFVPASPSFMLRY